jgi:hypothetical protein
VPHNACTIAATAAGTFSIVESDAHVALGGTKAASQAASAIGIDVHDSAQEQRDREPPRRAQRGRRLGACTSTGKRRHRTPTIGTCGLVEPRRPGDAVAHGSI